MMLSIYMVGWFFTYGVLLRVETKTAKDTFGLFVANLLWPGTLGYLFAEIWLPKLRLEKEEK